MYHITTTHHNQTRYYNAFNLMVNPPVLQTTPNLESAYTFATETKAQEWKDRLEKMFPEYEFQIHENSPNVGTI